MDFVVNEWLPEYFKPNASEDEKQKLETFLNRFVERGDKIFVRRPSEFYRKIHRYKKEYQINLKIHNEIGKFIKLILFDSERCFIVDDDDFELSDEIRNKLKEEGNYSSDTYLFEAASATERKLIITTDSKLKLFMENNGFEIQLLDDFLNNY
ncbi:MAG TPA: hypothetical protein VNG53_00035 [Bacteroidia bacterium]|nr:hypothetical protein [Bacteroidia bacterium]